MTDPVLEAPSEIREMVATIYVPGRSPWLKGDQAAAEYAGYASRAAFRKWAAENGIKPSVDGGLNFWDRAEIRKAREKGKR